MTHTDNLSLAAFILIGTGIIACLGDYITTQEGFDYGLTEKWPWTRFFMKHLGDGGAAAAGIAAFIFITGGLAAYSLGASIVLGASITGLEIFNTVRNFFAYRNTYNYKHGIKVPRDKNLQP